MAGLLRAFVVVSVLLASLQARAQDTVRIGWLSSLTGPLSSAAIAENQGVLYAVDEINKAGGILGHKVELLTRDTAGDPVKALNLAQQLVFADKVQFVIGPVNSGEALAVVPALAKAGIPDIVIGSLDQLTDPAKYPLAFRTINTNTQWIATANTYALDVLKRRKVAVIGDTSGYGTSSAKTATALLEKAGITPVYSVLIDPNKTDLTDEMNKARAAGADVVMPWSAATGMLARLLNTRGDMGWDVPVVGHPALMALPIKALLNKPSYWDNVFAAGYASTTYVDGKLPERTVALMDAIKPMMGGKIDFTFWWVALGYDSMKVVAYAATKANSLDPDKIKDVLEHTTDYPGVYGTYTWTPTNHNGFPDSGLVMNIGGTFKEGSYQAAPR
ncbi:MAG TPA: ABC transporter substrate-binding protein [Acidisphaera sp.]|nr:ABC transporter substrate-binding protein [Acidisphaera sp.]